MKNIITTAFKSTDNGIDLWINKKTANAPAQSSFRLSQVSPKGDNALVGQLSLEVYGVSSNRLLAIYRISIKLYYTKKILSTFLIKRV